MLLKNARIYLPQGKFEKADIRFDNGKITEVAARISGEGEDLSGLTILPGLCDIHSHGCVGCDWSRNNLEDYRKMALYYARSGVTSLCATTMSLPKDVLRSTMKDLARFIKEDHEGAYLQGINMEGPFFSKKKKGAQAEECLINPDVSFFEELQELSGGNILLCDLAPELEGAAGFIEALRNRVILSVAHTAADYDIAKKAIDHGIRHATHLYNAMTPFSHRDPGVVGAIFDSNITAEMISDGFHLHPATVRITFKILGGERIALISDSMEACGMSNGKYELGGQEVLVRDGLATLQSGTIAGSATNQFECMRRAIRFGVEPEEAVRAATATPMRILGKEDQAGSVATGKNADLVVVDNEFAIRRVFVRGREIAL